MSESNVALRYAESLIEVAAETGAVEPIAADLDKVVELLDANDGQFQAFVSSPVFSVDERDRVLDEVLPKLGLRDQTRNLIRLMNANQRLSVLRQVRDHFSALADERQGRVRVQVSTAEPLTPTLQTEIQAALEQTTGKFVIIEHTVDPSLIAGMVARVGGTVYDSSLRTRLASLKQSLVSGAH